MDQPFRPLTTRARLAVAALGLTMLVDAFSVYADRVETHLMDRLIARRDLPTLAALTASDHRQELAGSLQLAIVIAAAVTWVLWFSRAYVNVSALGAYGLRFTKGWAVGAWFVPFLNLWRPKQIADDVWRASDPEEVPAQGASWNLKRVPVLLNLWWAAWILDSVFGNYAVRRSLEGDTSTPAGLRHADQLDIAVMAIDLLAAVLAVVVIVKLTSRQERRRAAVADALPVELGQASGDA